MQMRTMGLLAFILFETCLVLPLAADQKPPVFVFGGKQLYVGMSKHEAVGSLAACCRLSPPAEMEVQTTEGVMSGHMILPKEESPQRVLGTVYFSGGKIVRITRSLDDEIDTWNNHVVAFARAINRALSPTMGDSEMTVRVSVRHERLTNGESDVLSLSFPNGRGIQIQIGTLDKPLDAHTNKRDFATLDEILDPARVK